MVRIYGVRNAAIITTLSAYIKLIILNKTNDIHVYDVFNLNLDYKMNYVEQWNTELQTEANKSVWEQINIYPLKLHSIQARDGPNTE